MNLIRALIQKGKVTYIAVLLRFTTRLQRFLEVSLKFESASPVAGPGPGRAESHLSVLTPAQSLEALAGSFSCKDKAKL